MNTTQDISQTDKIEMLRQVACTIRELNSMGATIRIKFVDKDIYNIVIDDYETQEILYTGNYSTWLAICRILGYEHVLKRIS